MAEEVLLRQVRARAERSGEPFEMALKVILETEAGQQLSELRGGPYHDERAKQWQEDLQQERARERSRLEHYAGQRRTLEGSTGSWG